MRLSVLRKAYCFRIEAEAAVYEDKSKDMTPDMVTDIFRRGLDARGIAHALPGDIFTEGAWKETLEAAYLAPDVP